MNNIAAATACLYYILYNASPGYKKIWDAKDFDSAVELPFEDEVFSAPIGFANILEQSYGDYMTPPPMRKRNEKHYKYAKWKER